MTSYGILVSMTSLSGWLSRLKLTLFLLAISFMYRMTSALRAESSPLVGSSRKRILGFVTRRLVMPSRFFWPPLRPFLMGVPTMVWGCPCRPKLAIRSSTLR